MFNEDFVTIIRKTASEQTAAVNAIAAAIIPGIEKKRLNILIVTITTTRSIATAIATLFVVFLWILTARNHTIAGADNVLIDIIKRGIMDIKIRSWGNPDILDKKRFLPKEVNIAKAYKKKVDIPMQITLLSSILLFFLVEIKAIEASWKENEKLWKRLTNEKTTGHVASDSKGKRHRVIPTEIKDLLDIAITEVRARGI